MLALFVLSVAAACDQRGTTSKQERLQVLEGLTLSQSSGGVPAWTLRSRRARLLEDENTARLDSPVMEFYRDGKPVSRATALEGEIVTDTHDVLLSSSVVLDSFDDRSRLETEQLAYSSARERFHTFSPVLIRRPGAVIRGAGLEANPDLSEIKIFHQQSTLSGRAL